MQQSPKAYRDKLRLRHHAYGVERRRNMSKIILEHGTPFPLPIEYSDIDNEMFEWLDKKINLVYEGKRVPTYKLYSTQRLSEYSQTWEQTDDYGNIIMNFKTVTRENNPQKGDINGGYFNIPGHKDFAMFYVPVLQENGVEAYDKYTMKQPFGVNFMYSLSIIANKMELVNEMNEQMHYEFSAINTYIAPNGHPMSMTLEDVSDESEYTIDDRKYYSQTYKVKVRGYIIRKEDYQVERIPSRIVVSSNDSDASGIVSRRGRNRREDEKVQFFSAEGEKDSVHEPGMRLFSVGPGEDKEEAFRLDSMLSTEECEVTPIVERDRPSEIYEETDGADDCCEDDGARYRNKEVRVVMKFGECDLELSFSADREIVLDSVEVRNVRDFTLSVNGEPMDLDTDIRFYKDDEVKVSIVREDLHGTSELVLVGYDPEVAYDNRFIPETVLDEPVDDEIVIERKENNEEIEQE